MRVVLAIIATIAAAAPAQAENLPDFAENSALDQAELRPYLQCAPYARKVSGIQIFGDARSWWEQAQGRYTTGNAPRVGAVMVFRPHRSMQLGHVATVSRLLDSRRVLLDHANWSPVDGRRGQVEKDVIAVDVSPANDWSEVRVWYAPLGDVGTTAWPIEGFIYADKRPVQVAQAPARKETSQKFLDAFAEFSD